MIGPIVQWVNTLLFFYYLVCNLIYLRLLVAAIKASVNQNRRQKTAWLDRIRHSPLTPPISLLVPAHNEELRLSSHCARCWHSTTRNLR